MATKRTGAVRKAGTKKGPVVGSGGHRKRGLEGKKATPKAKDRPYHKAYSAAQQRETIKTARKIAAAKKSNSPEYVLGRNPVVECLRSHIPALALYIVEGTKYDDRLTEAVHLAADRGMAILELPKSDLDKLTDNTLHQGLALQVPPYEYADPHDLLARCNHIRQIGENPVVVALDNITDPRNLGAIIRSSTAFGAAGVIIPARRSVGVTAVAWRTSAGTAAITPVAKATNLTRSLQTFAQDGFQIIGLDTTDAISLYDYSVDSPLIIVVGSEGKGLSRLVRQTCDAIVTIPMHEKAESLNASVAASIALAECARQKLQELKL